MPKLTDAQFDWLCERVADPKRSSFGGRPAADKRTIVQGIFWMLDNGARWKDLPPGCGSKSTVHGWFQTWVRQGVCEGIMCDAGRCVEQRGDYKLYACYIDGTFSNARGGGDGIGCTRVGNGVKIMVLVDTEGLSVAVDTMTAAPHESTPVQGLFDFVLTEEMPERIIGDKAYDSDPLDEANAPSPGSKTSAGSVSDGESPRCSSKDVFTSDAPLLLK